MPACLLSCRRCPHFAVPHPAQLVALQNAFINEGVDSDAHCALARRMCYSGFVRCLAQPPQQLLRAVALCSHGGDAVPEDGVYPSFKLSPPWASLETRESLVEHI